MLNTQSNTENQIVHPVQIIEHGNCVIGFGTNRFAGSYQRTHKFWVPTSKIEALTTAIKVHWPECEIVVEHEDVAA
jgi:hypothetical protein